MIRAGTWFAFALLALLAVPGAAGPDGVSKPGAWRTLEPGLEIAVFPAPEPLAGGGPVHVLRADPTRFDLRLVMSSEREGSPLLDVAGWCDREGLLAGINASMFQEDLRTSVSLMRSRTHVNNGHLTSHRAVLVFDPLDPGVPPVQIVDRDEQDYAAIARHYAAQVQNIRMIDLRGQNVWERQAERASIAALAIDRGGRVLLILGVAPNSVHDFVELLRALPLAIRNAMYLEGGPTAQLAVRAGGKRLLFAGVHETGFLGRAGMVAPVPVPNVIGIVCRKK